MTREGFAATGYAVVPVFDPARVRAALDDVAEHIDRLSHALYLPFEASCPEVPLARRLDRIWQVDRSHANLLRSAICTDAHRGPRLQDLANAPELKALAEDLAGTALGDSVVRVRASIAVFPEHLHDWHSDVARDDGTACGSVRITAWIPLTDTGPQQGGLEVIAARQAAPLAHREDRGFAIDPAALAALPKVQPSCSAGSAILLDRFTPHRSLPPGQDARFALVVWMKAA